MKNDIHNKQHARVLLARFSKPFFIFTAAMSLLASTVAFGFPTGSRGGSFFFGGSSLTLLWQTTDSTDNLATVQLNYFDDERLCFTGEVKGLYSDGTQTGEAVYELLGVDGASLNTTGICYSYVTQTCATLEDKDGNEVTITVNGMQGGGSSIQECTYTVPSLDAVDNNTDQSLDGLLSGRLRAVPGTGTDYLAACNDPTAASYPRICDFQVGIGFDTLPIPPNFFPATVTTDGDAVDANVILYANEICTQFPTGEGGLNLLNTAALNAKSLRLRNCEALAIKGDWCSDLQNAGYPKCDTTNANGQFTIGGFNNTAGDFLVQEPFSVTCVNDVSDLRGLGCDDPVNLAACGDGNGLIEMPTEYVAGGVECGDNPTTLSFSSSDGGGSELLDVASLLNFGSPGNPGDNSTPPCTSACIVSTPSSNEVNEWCFCSTPLYGIGFIDGRNNDDIITGSQGPDTIRGGSGADTLNGFGGDDILQGGDNADVINGDGACPGDVCPTPIPGDDLLLGYDCYGPNADCSVVSNNGSDNDILNGGPGNDCLDGGRGNDTARGDDGNDAFVLYGSVGNDIIEDYKNEGPDGEIDVFVDLTGNAQVDFVPGKQGKNATPSEFLIRTGGNDATTIVGRGGNNQAGDCVQCPEGVTTDCIIILHPTDLASGDALPPQCAAHPYSFQ